MDLVKWVGKGEWEGKKAVARRVDIKDSAHWHYALADGATTECQHKQSGTTNRTTNEATKTEKASRKRRRRREGKKQQLSNNGILSILKFQWKTNINRFEFHLLNEKFSNLISFLCMGFLCCVLCVYEYFLSLSPYVYAACFSARYICVAVLPLDLFSLYRCSCASALTPHSLCLTLLHVEKWAKCKCVF